MLAAILVMMAAAAAAPETPAPAPPNTVSPVTVTSPKQAKPPTPDAVVDVPADDNAGGQYVAVWPASAYSSHADGHVTLSCLVDVHGLAERCGVASETPAGKGFGAAALQIRTTFKLKPAQGPDRAPVNSVMNIAVAFKAPDTQLDVRGGVFKNNPLAMTAVTMVNRPVWVQAPSFEDLAKAYPAKAKTVEGYAVAHCQVHRTGALFNCLIAKELPEKLGFEKAAMSVVYKFKLSPDLASQRRRTPLWVDIPIRLPPPAATLDRVVAAPNWLTGVDPGAAPRVYPPEAVAKGVTSGRGVAECRVAAGGSMTGCTPEPGDPDGLGFSEAVTTLASKMKINLWSDDGAPVEGGMVRVAIRLNLKDVK